MFDLAEVLAHSAPVFDNAFRRNGVDENEAKHVSRLEVPAIPVHLANPAGQRGQFWLEVQRVLALGLADKAVREPVAKLVNEKPIQNWLRRIPGSGPEPPPWLVLWLFSFRVRSSKPNRVAAVLSAVRIAAFCRLIFSCPRFEQPAFPGRSSRAAPIRLSSQPSLLATFITRNIMYLRDAPDVSISSSDLSRERGRASSQGPHAWGKHRCRAAHNPDSPACYPPTKPPPMLNRPRSIRRSRSAVRRPDTLSVRRQDSA